MCNFGKLINLGLGTVRSERVQYIIFAIRFLIYGVAVFALQSVIARVTAQYDRWVHMQSNEPLIVKLQSNWKGYLARKAYKERKAFMTEQLPAIIRIQVGSTTLRQLQVNALRE